ncbi:MAG: ATP-binding protein [Burkholderiaceae bacterium]
MTAPWPFPLKISIPLLLLGFAAALSLFNALYHLPRAEHDVEVDGRKRVAQELSRLQSTLEYLLLKGDLAAAQHQVAVVAHDHDIALAALGDENGAVIAATRLAWLGRAMADVLPRFAPLEAAGVVRERRARVVDGAGNESLDGYASVLLGTESGELRPSRIGTLFLVYDLTRPRAEARALVLQQSLYWSGSVTVLAFVLWLVFHFMLTRRTARLVAAAERFAAGDLSARGRLSGGDELGKLSRVFDAMAARAARTERRLRRDIERRKQTERALRASEASYRTILDSVDDAIFLHDINTGAIEDVNPIACVAFGYSPAEFRNVDVGMLSSGVPPYTQEYALEIVARARAGEQIRLEWHGRHHDGRLRWDDLSIKRVTINGRDRILVMARDVTEKKRVAEELAAQREALYQREKLAALGSLLAGVSHELNNPLSVVVARAVMLEEEADAASRDAAVRIRSAAERCARIVRTFLAMARRQPPQRGPIAIGDVVAAALDIAGYAIRSSGIEVTLDLGRDVPLMLADGDQMHQVVLNLVINAQQSLQERSAPRRIAITTGYDAARRRIRLSVADNGPGVPPELRAHVFEPYFTTKSIGAGTGVGLAVSLGIIEAHGGTMRLESPPQGGAVFVIELPRGDVEGHIEGNVESPSGECSPCGTRPCAVLIVDDEPEIRDMLAEILTGPNRVIVIASSGRQALERIEGAWFDAIVTDIRMPDMDGPALYREVARRSPRQADRIVFVTGDTLTTGPGAPPPRPVIEKPFLPQDVRRVVAEVIDGH